jgi:hypothetical protein
MDRPYMTLNSAYTALSRATKLEYVHYEYTNKHFKRPQPTYRSKLVSLSPSPLIDGIIYEITDSEQTFFYIGETEDTIEERLARHKHKPVNKSMGIALSRPGAEIRISVIDRIKSSDKKTLLNLETFWIKRYAQDDEKKDRLLNIKGAKKAVAPDVVVNIVQPPPEIKKRFEVKPYHDKKFLIVRGWIPRNGDTPAFRKQYKFVYVADDHPKAATKSLAVQLFNANEMSLALNEEYTTNFMS